MISNSEVSIIVFTGPTCAGKTSVAHRLVNDHVGSVLVSARAILSGLVENQPPSRGELQQVGEDLERTTKGAWLRDAVGKSTEKTPSVTRVFVDSARTKAQVEALRSSYGDNVTVVHFTASPEARRARFMSGAPRNDVVEPETFDEILAHPIEREVDGLQTIADHVINTSGLRAHSAAELVKALLLEPPK